MGGEVGPEEEGEVDEEPDDWKEGAAPVDGLTASDDEGEWRCGAVIGRP